MKNDSSHTIFVTILFTLMLPIGIHCCGYNTYEIISLMSQDPDYHRNPCYIQWKEEQNAKMKELSIRKDELEKSIARNSEIEAENRRREDENRHNMFITTTVTLRSTASTIFGLLFIFVFFVFCCVGCVSWLTSDHNMTGSTSVPIPMFHAPVTQTAFDRISTNNNINVTVTENRRPFSRETNVPLLPQGVINRQNSLPSYDDAMGGPSAPPKE